MLSALIITRNEEAVIGRCLDSLASVDEIVVVDAHSTDRTPAICRSKGVKFIDMDWHGFGRQRNLALTHCVGPWVLAIDADEYVSTELCDEIRRTIDDPNDCVAFEISRLSSYCGRRIRHGGWWPDHVLRLFRKDCGRFREVAVHERLETLGAVGRLRNCLYHEAYADLDEVLRKVNLYSSLSAQQMTDNGNSASLLKAILRGAWTFFRNYVVLAGFLDGAEGFMLAVSSAEHTYYKYAKLYLLSKRQRLT
jgi:glycosyltransferase involved in cell wall biosynthesis